MRGKHWLYCTILPSESLVSYFKYETNMNRQRKSKGGGKKDDSPAGSINIRMQRGVTNDMAAFLLPPPVVILRDTITLRQMMRWSTLLAMKQHKI